MGMLGYIAYNELRLNRNSCMVLPGYPIEGCSRSIPEVDKLSPLTVYGGCFKYDIMLASGRRATLEKILKTKSVFSLNPVVSPSAVFT